MANEIMVIAKIKAPVDTANLQGDIRVLKNATELSPTAIIGNTKETPYAKFVHFGTKAHEIKAKNKKVLANRKLGRIYGKKVFHPGTKANPYFKKAVDEYVNSSEFNATKKAFLDSVKTNLKNEILKEFKS